MLGLTKSPTSISLCPVQNHFQLLVGWHIIILHPPWPCFSLCHSCSSAEDLLKFTQKWVMILFGDRIEQNKNGPTFLCFKQKHRCEISGHINLDCFLLEGKGIARFWGRGFWRSLWSSQQDSQGWNEPSQGFCHLMASDLQHAICCGFC